MQLWWVSSSQINPQLNHKVTDQLHSLAVLVITLMEKIINIKLMNVLEKENAISPMQYGFKKMRSQDALLKITTDIMDSFERKEQMVCVFFDMTQRGDTAS